MYKLSRYCNRVAYFFIHIGRKMIWDYTGKNKDILKRDGFGSRYTEMVMTGR